MNAPIQNSLFRPAASTVGARSVVSLFSGCGGMDLGFLGEFRFLGKTYAPLGNRIVFANDISDAACQTYRQNLGHGIMSSGIEKAIRHLPKSCDILIGGFPCQDVSVNGQRQAGKGQRTVLYRKMIKAIQRTRPEVFVAENVRGFLSCGFGQRVLSDFDLDGYALATTILLASDYGVPQNRERLFIVGVKGREPFRFPRPSRKAPITASAAISDLESALENPDLKHVWSRAKRSPEQGSRTLRADAPATTMRAEHHGNVQWHYSLPRRISLREQARFQSFPDDFGFPCGMRETERQIGNAVPPVLAWQIAKAIGNQVFT
ncbi:MAG: DNA (cytosine-5-)-methyltransferase [Aestuariivita sp.]|nr:DNA (cytosine-5-)-methyltransferase [Aestuariivita sp.]MCY4201235.1 DNA (cytosine-5-)-methyltransferase [Aestuariivita sp.]